MPLVSERAQVRLVIISGETKVDKEQSGWERLCLVGLVSENILGKLPSQLGV